MPLQAHATSALLALGSAHSQPAPGGRSSSPEQAAGQEPTGTAVPHRAAKTSIKLPGGSCLDAVQPPQGTRNLT